MCIFALVMKGINKILIIACALALFSSCIKGGYSESPEQREALTRQYVNQFAFNVMNVYYLWVAEIEDKLATWMTNDDPKQKILEVRYKDDSGKDIDRWSQITDDYASFIKSIENSNTTYGYEMTLFYTSATKEYISAVVTFVYADSPAEKAGLKRGDIILKVDGEPIPAANYADIVKNKMMYSESCTLTLDDGRRISMSSVEMYCNPVHMVKVFDCGGKKVGYLHFTAFTQNACADLVKACDALKAQGISELILDLRYNGGGYVQTEEVLASMLAPEPIVASGTVFMTEVYNALLTDKWDDDEKITYFRNRFKVNGSTVDTAESNLGLTKLYVIMSSGSASASEALVCGLKPFMDLDIVGQQSYGKYCSGYIIEAASWYDNYKDVIEAKEVKNGKKYAANWGIYVMVGRYADKNGETPCMPYGFTPDYTSEDNPLDGYQLGDPNETMLKTALTLAGYQYQAATASASAKKKPALIKGPASPKRETFGAFVHQK